MRNGVVGIFALVGLLAVSYGSGIAAEDKPAPGSSRRDSRSNKPPEPADKPLGPGWLTWIAASVYLDNAIASGKSSIEKAIGINISGFFDVGYNWASTHPSNPANITGRYFDKDYNKVEFNDFNMTFDKPEKDWGVGFHLSGDFGRSAELLGEATFWGRTLHSESSAQVRESYLTTTIPVGAGIREVKGGLFVTPLGTEIIPAPGAYNDNISRSFLFNYGVPLRHLGTLFSYPIYQKDKDTTVATGSAGIITGWDNPRDNNHTPSFLGGLDVTPNETIGFTSNSLLAESR